MKKTLSILACLACASVMAQLGVINHGIAVHGYGGEPSFKADNSAQTVDWLWFASNGVAVFEIPSNGIISASYGGTGTNSTASFEQLSLNPISTTNAFLDPTHVYASGFGTGTGGTNVNQVYVLGYAPNLWFGTNGSIVYSNAAIGAFAISNSFGDLLYTNSQVNSPTNSGWAVGIGKSSAGTVTNGASVTVNWNGYQAYATNVTIPAPIVGSIILCTSNYDLWLVTPTKTNLITAGH